MTLNQTEHDSDKANETTPQNSSNNTHAQQPPSENAYKNDSPGKNDEKGRALIQAKGLFAIIKEDYATHNRKFFTPGFQALAVYRFGCRIDNIGNKLIRPIASFVYETAYTFMRNFYGIEFYKTIKAGRRLILAHQHGIVIHRHATIGNDVIIRHNVTFGQGADWVDGEGPIIGDRVEFGPGSVVMGNITIGDDVSIGPNCTISTNIPADRTLFVPPPRVIPKQTTTPKKSN